MAASAHLSNAYLATANLYGATVVGVELTRAIWSDTICPNGPVTNTGC